LERTGPRGQASYRGNIGLEYCADFCLIAKRVLTPIQHAVFDHRYVRGGHWKLCPLKLSHRLYYYRCDQVEAILGKTFRTLEPYPLFPVDGVDGYFSTVRHAAPRPCRIAVFPGQAQPLRPPLRRAAPLAKAA
jgi:hypothetical protein